MDNNFLNSLTDKDIMILLKPHQEKLEFDNPKELIDCLVGIINKNNEGLSKVLNAIYENQYKLFAMYHRTMTQIQEKIENKDSFDFVEIEKEATNYINNRWPEMRKAILNELQFQRIIDNSFETKNQEQEGEQKNG